MDKHNSNQEQLWKQCPKGLLLQVASVGHEKNCHQKVTSQQSQFDRRRMLQIAAAVAVSAGAGTIAYRSLFASASSMGYGGISCSVCLANLEKHIQKGLEESLAAKMDQHLETCRTCRAKYDMMLNA